MIYDYNHGIFSISYHSCTNDRKNFREQCEDYAVQLKTKYKENLALSLSSGLDCQLVLHSFYKSNIDINCFFMHLPGHNDTEVEQIEVLEKKYNIKVNKIEIDIFKRKDEILSLSKATDIHPWQIVYFFYFLEIDDRFNLIKGFEGPDFCRDDNKFKLIQSYHSSEISKVRAYTLTGKPNDLICYDYNDQLLFSLLKDPIVKSYLNAYNYYEKANLRLSNRTRSKVGPIDRWDLFLKPIVYAHHWKEELEYFPKKVGCETIDFIAEYEAHRYRDNMVLVDLEDLLHHFEHGDGFKTYSQL